MIMIPQPYRQTDGQTDRQLALAIPRSARFRAVKMACDVYIGNLLRYTQHQHSRKNKCKRVYALFGRKVVIITMNVNQ